jgi:general L-amino acid transport system permease protein
MALVTGTPWTWSLPRLQGFGFKGGSVIIPEFLALLLALTIYTAAFIGEIVRAGIQAVSHGQTEAAHALGIKPGTTLRLVIVPQAMRIIIPPLISQYLNLTKNSSLAPAIGYPEMTQVFAGTVLNQSGQALECMAMVMGTYCLISLSISGGMNWYNARVSLVER